MTPREREVLSDLDGQWVGSFLLRTGEYGNGRMAIQAIAPDGIPECTVTVNLIDDVLSEGEFFVRFEAREHSRVFEALIADGIAAPTGRVVAAGRVDRYAEAWRLEGFD